MLKSKYKKLDRIQKDKTIERLRKFDPSISPLPTPTSVMFQWFNVLDSRIMKYMKDQTKAVIAKIYNKKKKKYVEQDVLQEYVNTGEVHIDEILR